MTFFLLLSADAKVYEAACRRHRTTELSAIPVNFKPPVNQFQNPKLGLYGTASQSTKL